MLHFWYHSSLSLGARGL